MSGLSNDPYQVQDLRGRTAKPKAAAFAASAGEAGLQTEVFDSPTFPLTGQHTECRITELPNKYHRISKSESQNQSQNGWGREEPLNIAQSNSPAKPSLPGADCTARRLHNLSG